MRSNRTSVERSRHDGAMEELDAAIAEWSERRTSMRDVDDDRLWKKLRLEWN